MRRFYRGLIRLDGEAVSLGHEYVGAEHLLLAIAVESNSAAARVLAEAGIDVERSRAFLGRLPASAEPVLVSPLPLAPSSQQALECAATWVRRLRPRWARREHLLLGILDAQAGMVPLLPEEFGAQPGLIRAEILQEQANRH